ncbi:MAG: S-layer homology domain-containing protein [Oscillospiraceae bacterium]|jgi:uncharacterized repeat protein (TIGR02543 family)|nr:S-layer homology domain-containing protein [Oscillospiraceae bacterium]
MKFLRTFKRLAAVALMAAMLLALTPLSALAVEVTVNSFDDLNTAIAAANGTADGYRVNIVLNGDIAVSSTLWIEEGMIVTIQSATGSPFKLHGTNNSRVIGVSGPGDNKLAGELTLKNVIITDGRGDVGAGILVQAGGKLTLDAGAKVTGNGNAFSFDTDGKTVIDPNNYTTKGGGIRNETGGTVTIKAGAEISGNWAVIGGGISNSGTLIMDGGTISGNSAVWGGGVANESDFLDEDGKPGSGGFTQTGGDIETNKVYDLNQYGTKSEGWGAGVADFEGDHDGQSQHTGGTISNNTNEATGEPDDIVAGAKAYFKVTFDLGDGTASGGGDLEQSVEYSDSAVLPTDPVRTGYRFNGWDGDYTNVTSVRKITAKWIKTYTVTFNLAGGSASGTLVQTIDQGTNATPPTNLTRQGYTFTGWIGGSYTNVTSDQIITATWTANSGGGGGGGGGGGYTPPTPPSPSPSASASPSPSPTTIPDDDTPLGGKPWPIFEDVLADDWFYADVEYVYQNDIMNGTDATHFSPGEPLTRGMVATIIGRISAVDTTLFVGSRYDDVALGAYYTPYIEWGSDNGLLTGYGDGIFKPDQLVTRQEFAAIVGRYLNFLAKTLPTTRADAQFSDESDIAEYAAEFVHALYREGLFNGDDYGNFLPQSGTTRGQAAAVFHRLLEAIA